MPDDEARPPQGAVGPGTPVRYTIDIAVDPPRLTPRNVPLGGSDGNFVYQPALLRVQADDTITWTCDHPFTLVFKEGTPIERIEVFGTPAEGRAGYSTGAFTVQQVKGHFHYVTAVWKDNRVYMDASCPHISVN
ncbi:MAG: hypothetical protein ABSH56_02905 [Bryobacteraceae bacterium]|jgi:plastocyanin